MSRVGEPVRRLLRAHARPLDNGLAPGLRARSLIRLTAWGLTTADGGLGWRGTWAAGALTRATVQDGDPGAASALAALLTVAWPGHELAVAATRALTAALEAPADPRRAVGGAAARELIIEVLADHWTLARSPALLALLESAAGPAQGSARAFPDTGEAARVPLLLLLAASDRASPLSGIIPASHPAPLVEALDDPDGQVRAAAADLLRATTAPDAMDALAAAWLADPDDTRMALLIANPTLPGAPAAWLAVAALQRRHEAVAEFGAYAVPALLGQLRSAPAALAAAIGEALRSLTDPAARERVCALAAAGDSEAMAVALDAGYLPVAEPDRAAFLIATGQWDRYHALDIDGRLARLAYSLARPELQARLRDTARGAGRPDILRAMLTGAPGALTRTAATTSTSHPADASRAPTPAEAADLARALIAAGRHGDLWNLARAGLPFVGSLVAVARLRAAGWSPSEADEAEVFGMLVRACQPPAEGSTGEPRPGPDHLSVLPPALRPLSTFDTGVVYPGYPLALVLAADSAELTIASRLMTKGHAVSRWDVVTGQRLWAVNQLNVLRLFHSTGGEVFAFQGSGRGEVDGHLVVLDGTSRRVVSSPLDVAAAVPGPNGTAVIVDTSGRVTTWSRDGDVVNPGHQADQFWEGGRWGVKAALSAAGRVLCLLDQNCGISGRVVFDGPPGPGRQVFLYDLRDGGPPLAGTVPARSKEVAFTPDGVEVLFLADHVLPDLDPPVHRNTGLVRYPVNRRPDQADAVRWPDAEKPVTAFAVVEQHGVVVISREHRVEVRSWPGGELVDQVRAEHVDTLTVSPDGGLLSAGSSGRFSNWALFPAVIWRPLSEAKPSDLTGVESWLAQPAGDRHRVHLEALAALLRHRFRHEVQVGDAPRARVTDPRDIQLDES
ncbi:hypothetical protein I6A84_30405 [Frankia sp. CNm7]|uniref:Uncharacterized protein n=1 Tax=Frankia nepalensis TaxID=1836974 RepID=A0A937RDL2_9ACTN|nr:hypothetical protein [Frankia nepalensis]MBL7500831.1 hypothetical protein [Frankia nepalensis]MBL7515312.1 hypothetical protein [Frankia nepalensis]MBL7522275.1 hypothetical protein [Frankia nepalensis]MBL7627040.1 hypothetical protein [Frankia nepalensis]